LGCPNNSTPTIPEKTGGNAQAIFGSYFFFFLMLHFRSKPGKTQPALYQNRAYAIVKKQIDSNRYLV